MTTAIIRILVVPLFFVLVWLYLLEFVLAQYPLFVWDRMKEYHEAGYNKGEVALQSAWALLSRTYMLLVIPISLVATVPSAFGASLRFLIGDPLDRYKIWNQRRALLEIERPLRVKELRDKRKQEDG